jgi:hypothetical protein
LRGGGSVRGIVRAMTGAFGVVMALLAAAHGLWIASLYFAAKRARRDAAAGVAMPRRHIDRSPAMLLAALLLTVVSVTIALLIAVEEATATRYQGLAAMLAIPALLALSAFAQCLVLLATNKAQREGSTAFAVMLAVPAFAITACYASMWLG